MSSSLATVGFKWVDILEKEFDKSFLALDEVLRNLSEDYEVPEMYDINRKLLSNLGSCFVQSVHKAQTIFQSQAKQEANLIHLREELAEAKANMAKLDAEKQYLVCRLQSTLLENHKLKTGLSGDNKVDAKSSNSEQVCQDIQLKLAKEMAVIQRVDWEAKKLEQKCTDLEDENCYLRQTQVELESELVGARLDSKYLDKELAGRIQQIQILLAGGTSQDHKQKVWSQIEAEMHLQRSKTISNMCYSKQRVKESAMQKQREREEGGGAIVDGLPLKPMNPATSSTTKTRSVGSNESDDKSRESSYNGVHSRGSKLKQVHIHKNDAEELGMAILGGFEHGLPIMISEVFPNTSVGRCEKICAGDVILAVNGDPFTDMPHNEAVRYLSSLRGTIKFDLENRIDDEIDEVCDMDNRYYDMLFENEEDEGGRGKINNNQKLRQQQRILLNHPGRAKKDSKSSHNSGSPRKTAKELPEVHSSPRRTNNNTTKTESNGQVEK